MANFRTLCAFTAALTLMLFLALLMCPQLIFYLFQIADTESGVLISRRAAVLFAGLSILVWLLKGERPGAAQNAVCASFGTLMTGLACLGVTEYYLGNAGPGILLAVVGETAIGVNFLYLYFSNQQDVLQRRDQC